MSRYGNEPVRHAYDNRRDANEPELIAVAEKLGWFITRLDVPCDLLGLFRGRWFPIEVKREAGPLGGLKDKTLTDTQGGWHKAVQSHGGAVLIWRTVQDVVDSSSWRP